MFFALLLACSPPPTEAEFPHAYAVAVCDLAARCDDEVDASCVEDYEVGTQHELDDGDVFGSGYDATVAAGCIADIEGADCDWHSADSDDCMAMRE